MADRELIIKVMQEGNAAQGLGNLSGALGGLGKVALGGAAIGITAATGAIIGVGMAAADATKEAMASEEAQADLNAVLESTRGIAGVTSQAANDLANSLMNVTRFDDEAILSGESMLLTFTNIGKDVFPQATEATLDMAQKFGMDVPQAAVTLGKALNDPISGVTALRRIGIMLTDQQKDQIASFMAVGDVASAQKIILGELKTEIGGVARAAGETTAGQFDILANKFNNVKEAIGTALLPILGEVSKLLSDSLSAPETQEAITALTNFIKDPVVPTIKELFSWLREKVVPVFQDFFKELKEVGGPAMLLINDAFERIAKALGIQTDKVNAGDIAIKVLKISLDLVVTAVKAFALAMQLAANIIESVKRAIDGIKRALDEVKHKWDEFGDAAARAVDRIPDWLVPHSPTKFEMGLRGIASAAQQVNGSLNVNNMSAGAGGGRAVTINLTWSPTISLADKYEVQTKLIPMILEGLRGAV